MTDPYLSVVIPAYNESARLPPTLDVVTAWLREQDFTSEIVVVDDGSTDDTAGIARQTLGEFPHQCITHEQNRGKGAGLKTGMVAARGEFVLFTDADLSTPIEEASRFLELHAQGQPIVIGTRKSKGAQVTRRQAALRERMGRVYTWLSNVMICPGVSDFTCGFKSFSRESSQAIFSRLREAGWAYDTEVLYLSRRLGYSVQEVPVRWANDPSSRVNLLRDSVGSALGLVRIRTRALFGAYENPTQ